MYEFLVVILISKLAPVLHLWTYGGRFEIVVLPASYVPQILSLYSRMQLLRCEEDRSRQLRLQPSLLQPLSKTSTANEPTAVLFEVSYVLSPPVSSKWCSERQWLRLCVWQAFCMRTLVTIVDCTLDSTEEAHSACCAMYILLLFNWHRIAKRVLEYEFIRPTGLPYHPMGQRPSRFSSPPSTSSSNTNTRSPSPVPSVKNDKFPNFNLITFIKDQVWLIHWE